MSTASGARKAMKHSLTAPSRWRRFLGSGLMLMTLATLAFTVMVAAVKVVRQDMGPFDVIAWRGLISAPLAAAAAWRTDLRIGRWPVFMARAILGFSAMSCFFTATKGLPLTDLALISRLQPVLIAVVAPPLLGSGERSGPFLWIALAVGLVGCGVLIGPELSLGNRFGLWAVGGAVASALAHTAVRALGRTEAPRAVVFWFQLSNLPVAVALLFMTEGRWPALPSWSAVGPLLVAGLATTVGQLLMTKAYQQERAALVAAATYSGPLWSVLMDLVVFGVAPGWAVAAGGGLLLVAGYLLHRAQTESPVKTA